jgi:hypothetical protein
MKYSLFTIVAGALAAVTMAMSQAANAEAITLGTPAYGGTGCPAGSASATLSPDATSLSILFDSYVAEAGGVTGRMIDRKSCNLAIPVHVPHGYSISIFQVDYRGFTAIPFGGRAQFNVEYFFAGMRGPRVTKNFGPSSQNYALTDRLVAESLVWSPCGADTNLRVNSNMLAQSNSQMQQAMATVDSADVTSGLIYQIQWRRCQ